MDGVRTAGMAAVAFALASLAGARDELPVFDEKVPAPIPISGTNAVGHVRDIESWLTSTCPGLDRQSAGVQALERLLSHWTHADSAGRYAVSTKYYNIGAAAFGNWQRLDEALAARDLPRGYRQTLTSDYARRLIELRLALDVAAELARIEGIPAGGREVKALTADAFGAALTQSYPQWPRSSPLARLGWLEALAAFNPVLRQGGTYRLARGESVREDWPHVAVPLADGRMHVRYFHPDTNGFIYLPPAGWLDGVGAATLAADSAAVPAVTPRSVVLDLPEALPGKVTARFHALLGEDGWEKAFLTLPGTDNRYRPLYPAALPGVADKEDLDTLADPRLTSRFELAWAGGVSSRGKPQSLTLTVGIPVASQGAAATYSVAAGAVPFMTGTARPAAPESPRPLAPGRGWPSWLGPDGDGAAVPSGRALVADLAGARLLWASDDDLPDGRGVDTRGKPVAVPRGRPIMGGWASPVVADGKVVVSYFVPSGDAWSYGSGALAAKGDAALYRANRVLADDVVHCFDAVTGRTVWRRAFAGKGLNWAGFNKGGPQLTPAISGQRVFAMGTTGRIYALELSTGEVVWEADIGPRFELMAHLQQRLAAAGELLSTRNDFMSNVIVADGVVVVSDQRRSKLDYRYELDNGLIGLDAATGKRLWVLPEVADRNGFHQGAQLWRHDGHDYVLAPGSDGVRLIEPRTGRVLWLCRGVRARHTALGVAGDLIVGDAPAAESAESERAGATVVAYRIDPAQARLAWELPATFRGLVGGALFLDGRVYLQCSLPEKRLVVADAARGSVLASAPVDFAAGEHCPFIVGGDGRVLVCRDRTSGLVWMDADPARLAASVRPFDIELATGYCGSLLPAWVDGRLFIRAPNRLLCYDLRESL